MPATTNTPLTVVGLLCAVFLAAMEATVVATAMPSVVADLGEIQRYGWVGAVYLLSSTVTMPLFGKLADERGRKPVLLWGVGIFLLGSVASGSAQTMTQLIIARSVQGLGAGGIQPISMTVVGDLFRPEKRARVQALFGAVWALAGVAGPLLGGFLVANWSWRWVFFVNLPFGLLSAALLFVAFSENPEVRRRRFDLLGIATLSSAVVCLLLGVEGTQSWATLPAAAALLFAFIHVEQRAEEPLISLESLRLPLMASSNLTCVLLGAVMMGILLYVPLHVQSVLGRTPTEAGTSVAPMMLGWPLAASFSGRLLVRFGYRRMVRTGGLALLCSSVLLLVAASNAEHPLGWFRMNALLAGVGLGFANTALMIAVQESVSWGQRGVATAGLLFSRTIGGALAAGMLGGLLAASLPDGVDPARISDLLHANLARPAASSETQVVAQLDDAMTRLFVAIGVMSAAACLAAFTFPRHAATPRLSSEASS